MAARCVEVVELPNSNSDRKNYIPLDEIGGGVQALRATKAILWDDMHEFVSSTALAAWAGLNGGTTGALSIPSTIDDNRIGTASLNTGGAANGRMTLNRTPFKVRALPGKLIYEAACKYVNLSDAVEEFAAWHGLSDTTGDPTAMTDGIYFEYDRAGLGANLRLVAEKDNARTLVDLGFAPVADTYYVSKFEVLADGTVQAYIGTTVANLVAAGTPIPAAAVPVDSIFPFMSMLKSVGTTNRLFRFDYVYIENTIAR